MDQLRTVYKIITSAFTSKPRPTLDLPTLPHITSTIARYLFPDIKSTLRLALTSADTFAVIARHAPLWRSLYIHNEEIDESFMGMMENWTIKDNPELVRILTDPAYTDHTRKIGEGRLKRSVWFRCAMLMAMGERASVLNLAGYTSYHDNPARGPFAEDVQDTIVPKVLENGEWESDVEVVDREEIKLSLDHSVAYRTLESTIINFMNQNPPPTNVSNLSNKIKFGDWASFNERRGDGKYYVTMASAVGCEGKVKYALEFGVHAYEDYCAVPQAFAPPTFPFSYHLGQHTSGYLAACCLKNGKGLTFIEGVAQLKHDQNFAYGPY
ncbi:hypothetical protein HDV00_005620 [Rhizophlyctis rosea]|nr:hypothetical protein HDV00_005620 [Rhizophlyctis rosea]